MRKVQFENGEYYHVYNRGVDKRDVFLDSVDIARFYQSMEEFNTLNPIGSLHENRYNKKNKNNSLGHAMSKPEEKLVNFISYCLNPNHYHLLLEELIEGGISEFMRRVSIGYTKYFNEKYKRSGVLFQGRFKRIIIDSNEYLLHLSVYINLNNKVHSLGHRMSKSSWREYMGEGMDNFCEKDIVLGQFKSIEAYKKFAEDSLESIRERKDLEKYLLE